MLAPTTIALASTVSIEEFLCPIDKTTFESNVQSSFYVQGMRLDLKPLGAVLAPEPVPVCPKDHFVVLDYEPEDLDKLKDYIPSAEYQQFAKEHSASYALVAKILEYLGATPSDVGYAYLQASWQVEDQPHQNVQYLTESLKLFRQALEGHLEVTSDSISLELLATELERRLGHFDLAENRLRRIKSGQIALEGFLLEIVDYQLQLVANGDRGPHEAPSNE